MGKLTGNLRMLYNEGGNLASVLKTIRKDAKDFCQEVFQEKFAKFFADHPNMESVTWTACSMYNDETTKFYSHHEDAEVDGSFTGGEQQAAEDDVLDFLGEFSKEDMQGIFGEEIKVIITREGVTTEAYYYDY